MPEMPVELLEIPEFAAMAETLRKVEKGCNLSATDLGCPSYNARVLIIAMNYIRGMNLKRRLEKDVHLDKLTKYGQQGDSVPYLRSCRFSARVGESMMA
jgi:hypothetical protein